MGASWLTARGGSQMTIGHEAVVNVDQTSPKRPQAFVDENQEEVDPMSIESIVIVVVIVLIVLFVLGYFRRGRGSL